MVKLKGKFSHQYTCNRHRQDTEEDNRNLFNARNLFRNYKRLHGTRKQLYCRSFYNISLQWQTIGVLAQQMNGTVPPKEL